MGLDAAGSPVGHVRRAGRVIDVEFDDGLSEIDRLLRVVDAGGIAPPSPPAGQPHRIWIASAMNSAPTAIRTMAMTAALCRMSHSRER